MITKSYIKNLYRWAKDTEIPTKTAPTKEGYSNKSIDYYWIKSVKKSTLIREKLMTDSIREIYKNDDILFSNYTIFMQELYLNLIKILIFYVNHIKEYKFH